MSDLNKLLSVTYELEIFHSGGSTIWNRELFSQTNTDVFR